MSSSNMVPVRGVPLVERVLTLIEEQGFELFANAVLDDVDAGKPIRPEAVTKLTLADGHPLPPSIAHWIAAVGTRSLLLQSKADRLVARGLSDLAGEAFGAEARAYIKPFEKEVLPGKRCYRLPTPSVCPDSAICFVYADEPDEVGDYPVLALDFGDSGMAGIFACGFDLYLARVCGVIDAATAYGSAPAGYEQPWKTITDRCLRGQSVLDILPFASG